MRVFVHMISIVSLVGLLTIISVSISRQTINPVQTSTEPASGSQTVNSDNTEPPAVEISVSKSPAASCSVVDESPKVINVSLPAEGIQAVAAEPSQIQPETPPSYLSRLPVYLQNFMGEWKLEQSGGCMEAWNFTPGLSKLPSWLTTPASADGLTTNTAYYILAGMLIRNKLVDASSCPSGGLASIDGDNLSANNCGMNLALPAVISWQNRFNQKIYDVAQQSGIPAVLLKNIFRQESQFWPGIFMIETESGLGQITSVGADALLMWSPTLFDSICSKSFSTDVCGHGYTNLSSGEKAILQGALFQLVNASCPGCPGGVDLQQAEFSINVFAENLLSNCKQTGALVTETASVKYPSLVSTYTDLWKMTLFNYNAGPGCLERAVRRAWTQDPNSLLTWDRIVSQVDTQCLGGINYVSEITK